MATILRDGQVYPPDADQPVESGDELLFVVSADVEEELERLLAPSLHGPRAIGSGRRRARRRSAATAARPGLRSGTSPGRAPTASRP
ncbi:TrkA C-terminal domain-containing protein [Nocardioides psychrotolerans]|uniref:TrkA C-terminal domain-containing protein n=1 Tax=Nocardioides psychrotolerans TaxID=1005945 RepID=UPI001FEAFA9D|nr:TrkA C-terminal domain-containing protein [Nocardioides psychrotolerans]